MGCVSSKLFRKDLQRDLVINNGGDCVNHVVSLTSSTYGVLSLDKEKAPECKAESRRSQRSPPKEEPEIINAWELMGDLEDGIPISKTVKSSSPKPRLLIRGFGDIDPRSPLKFLNQIGSPRKAKTSAGKENRGGGRVNGVRRWDYSPKEMLKANNKCKRALNLSTPMKNSPVTGRRESFGSDCGMSSRRKSVSPLFDPELVASYERELCEEGEQIKRTVSETTPKARATRLSREKSETLFLSFEKKCPPGGENAVVVYTTTLRGIRKTFEACNAVRSIIESHDIRLLERDVSMDSGYKEELRNLMGTKEVKVPVVFIKGRLIGGADEVVKLEEEGMLAVLFHGIPPAAGGCEGCAGVRFVMCMECCGSRKVLDEAKKKKVKCEKCNENGLIQCPICCS